MSADPNLRSRLVTLLDKLPNRGQKELEQYLDFLEYKYRLPPKKPSVVALGGLWGVNPLGVTEAEIRALRQASSNHLLDEMEDGLSS
jgi:hypothetical protein